jgi:hypothetical protein
LGKEEGRKLQHMIEKKVGKVGRRHATTLERKLSWLRKQKCKRKCGVNNTVVNVSKRVLATTERAVLEKGLNFCMAPKKVPKFEIIKSTETAKVRLAPEKA